MRGHTKLSDLPSVSHVKRVKEEGQMTEVKCTKDVFVALMALSAIHATFMVAKPEAKRLKEEVVLEVIAEALVGHDLIFFMAQLPGSFGWVRSKSSSHQGSGATGSGSGSLPCSFFSSSG